MKALTLYEPWAFLVAVRAKKIETRSWKTDYRGPLAIHASKNIPSFAEIMCETEEHFNDALKDAGIYFTGDVPLKVLIPCGAVLCICNLVDCLKILRQDGSEAQLEDDRIIYQPEYFFGDYALGRYAWILNDVKKLEKPIPAKGQLGLWNWEPPEGMEL